MALKAKRNFFVSYLKGWAIVAIMLIHLLDWSGVNWAGLKAPGFLLALGIALRQFLYPGVMFFIALSGSLIYIAYNKYDLLTAAKKSWRRGLELIGVYFLYNIAKLLVFNFAQEPFYLGFAAAGNLNLSGVLSLRAFTVPITIILTIGAFLLISPLWLWLAKRKYAQVIFPGLILALAAVNYLAPLADNALINFLYAKNNVMFPLALWLLPYLIGFYLGMLGLEKFKGRLLILFSALAAACAWTIFSRHGSLNLTDYMYPLGLYYVCFSFAFMYVLIYLFYFLEKAKSAAINFLLSIFRVLGDFTLAVYVYHWLVIDLTLWLIFPRAWLILLTVPLFLIGYLIIKRKKLAQYYADYEKVV